MHFEVYEKRTQRADNIRSITQPRQYPCYELVHNYDWNDYGCYNWFSLWYFDKPTIEPKYIGDIKIMTSRDTSTIDALGVAFDEKLDSSFCSLGIGTSYYNQIHRLLSQKEASELLLHLRDCVFSPSIREEFQQNSEFTSSLCRDQESEEALEDGQLYLSGMPEDKAYSIAYNYAETYGNHNLIPYHANFQYRCAPYLRIMGIIGENGLGKTQMLSHLVEALCSHDLKDFDFEPLFKGCVVLSSTPWDRYPSWIKDARISYCRYTVGQGTESAMTNIKDAISEILLKNPIRGHSIIEEYMRCLNDVIGPQLNTIIDNIYDEGVDMVRYEVNGKEVDRIISILSSGQLHLFSLVTYLFSKSHLSTLFILDEPEVHLHPHIMVLFMRVLAFVLNLYNSYAIIATHSPLIIRELVKQNVQIMERIDDDITIISPVLFDTFGEDIATLYHKVFEYNDRDSFFYHIVTDLLKRMSFDKVVEKLSHDMDLNLNARLIIRDLAKAMKKLDA